VERRARERDGRRISCIETLGAHDAPMARAGMDDEGVDRPRFDNKNKAEESELIRRDFKMRGTSQIVN
jgi:hypothetical protein